VSSCAHLWTEKGLLSDMLCFLHFRIPDDVQSPVINSLINSIDIFTRCFLRFVLVKFSHMASQIQIFSSKIMHSFLRPPIILNITPMT
jgi:hypothetical protein